MLYFHFVTLVFRSPQQIYIIYIVSTFGLARQIDAQILHQKRQEFKDPKKALEFYLKLNVALEEQRERLERMRESKPFILFI